MINSIKKTIKSNKLIKNFFYRSNSKSLLQCLKREDFNKACGFNHYNLYCTSGYSEECFFNSAKIIRNYVIKQLSKKDKIKVGFVVYSSQMWSCSKLYDLFADDNRFEPFIIVCRMKTYSLSAEEEIFNNSLSFFNNSNYNVVNTDGTQSDSLYDYGNPDLLIYLTPYTTSLKPTCFNISSVPLDRLCVYIPYSYMVSDNDKMFENNTFNLAWKFFCESRIYKKLLEEKTIFSGYNAVYTGFPGLDSLIEGKDQGIFKNAEGKKKIIYAPHFSIGSHGIGFSTFDKNYKFMLDLAKETSDSVSWVIKPHPKLKAESVDYGLFANEQEYDDYINEWDKLSNARSITHGSYADLFAESDAIILDSASFLVEYQFTGNPLLFLTNSRQKFNSYGTEVLKTVYTADGENFEQIKDFVFRVVISGKDIKNAERKDFFNKELNYIEHNNGLTASQKIYTVIRSEFINEH